MPKFKFLEQVVIRSKGQFWHGFYDGSLVTVTDMDIHNDETWYQVVFVTGKRLWAKEEDLQ